MSQYLIRNLTFEKTSLKMNNLTNIIQKSSLVHFQILKPFALARNYNTVIEPPDEFVTIPTPTERRNETVEIRKARLTYQSRKRGMLENDLLLSTFIDKYLNKFTEQQLNEYDLLINTPSNDWDIYYWATEIKPTPEEYEHSVMKLLREHCKNLNKESRIQQPNL